MAFDHVVFGEMGATVAGVIITPNGQKAAWFEDSEGNTFALSMADRRCPAGGRPRMRTPAAPEGTAGMQDP